MYVRTHTYVSTYIHVNLGRLLPKTKERSWRRIVDAIINWFYLVTVSDGGRAADEFTPSTLFRDIVCNQIFKTYSVVVPVMGHFTPPNPHWNCDARVKSYQPNILLVLPQWRLMLVLTRLLENAVTPTKRIQPHREDLSPTNGVQKREDKCPIKKNGRLQRRNTLPPCSSPPMEVWTPRIILRGRNKHITSMKL